jgi:hypothetical protein
VEEAGKLVVKTLAEWDDVILAADERHIHRRPELGGDDVLGATPRGTITAFQLNEPTLTTQGDAHGADGLAGG